MSKCWRTVERLCWVAIPLDTGGFPESLHLQLTPVPTGRQAHDGAFLSHCL